MAVAAVITSLLLILAGFQYLLPKDPESPRLPEDPELPRSFTFGAVGDLASTSDTDMPALAQRLGRTNASFLLALGDLGYAPDEKLWCAAIKAGLNEILVIAGNHDVGEGAGGNISRYVIYCPFTLGVSVTAGPGTPGYGFEYYFDYPSSDPLARFVLITAGLRGNLNYDYSPGSKHYNWVVNAVQGARDEGIQWVVVGLHKQCIGVHVFRGCTMGQAMFDKLVELRVDLILQGHDHVYERSKQLALSGTCTSVVSDDRFNPDCVVDDGADGVYGKGNGTVVVVNGAGGTTLYDVVINGSDPEIGYFVEVMGGNENTQDRDPGFGAVVYAVSASSIQARTDFCPAGTVDADGRCDVASRFHDEFAIREATTHPLGDFVEEVIETRAASFNKEEKLDGKKRLLALSRFT